MVGEQKRRRAGSLRTGLCLAAGVLAAVLAGCVGPSPVVRMFEGPMSPSDIATISNESEVKVAAVDGLRVTKNMRFGRGRSVTRIEMLPGRHRVVLTRETPKSAFNDTAFNAVRPFRIAERTLSFEVEAGRLYTLGEDLVMVPYSWSPWIKESTTGRLIAPAPATNAPAAGAPAATAPTAPRQSYP